MPPASRDAQPADCGLLRQDAIARLFPATLAVDGPFARVLVGVHGPRPRVALTHDDIKQGGARQRGTRLRERRLEAPSASQASLSGQVEWIQILGIPGELQP